MLEKTECIFFDVDDTIFDFDKCAAKSLENGFKKFSLKYDDQVLPTFKTINKGFWRRIEKGEINRAYLTAHRFETVFASLGIDFDGPTFEKEFLQGLYDSCEAVDGAFETVRYLADRYPLYVASNAFYAQQVNRLTLAGIIDCFKGIFVSEKLGCNKPSPQFFRKILDLAGVSDASRAVMVGDSLEADIIGAKAVGMRTIWFTKEKGSAHADLAIDALPTLKKYF